MEDELHWPRTDARPLFNKLLYYSSSVEQVSTPSSDRPSCPVLIRCRGHFIARHFLALSL